VQPELQWFRQVSCDGHDRPMTSIERERRGPVRQPAVRQRLLAGFAERFRFDRVSLFHHHPALKGRAPAHAAVADPC
jgi:lipoyl(octanoyl) transferase